MEIKTKVVVALASVTAAASVGMFVASGVINSQAEKITDETVTSFMKDVNASVLVQNQIDVLREQNKDGIVTDVRLDYEINKLQDEKNGFSYYMSNYCADEVLNERWGKAILKDEKLDTSFSLFMCSGVTLLLAGPWAFLAYAMAENSSKQENVYRTFDNEKKVYKVFDKKEARFNKYLLSEDHKKSWKQTCELSVNINSELDNITYDRALV